MASLPRRHETNIVLESHLLKHCRSLKLCQGDKSLLPSTVQAYEQTSYKACAYGAVQGKSYTCCDQNKA